MNKLFYNATFLTMRDSSDIAKGLLVNRQGTIERLFYKDSEIKALLKTKIEPVDLDGYFVYPGFVDTHTHSFEGGLYTNAANLADASSLSDVYDILTSVRSKTEIIIAYHLDEKLLKEKRFPTLKELDDLFPDKVLIIRRVDGHSSVINTKAFEVTGLKADYSDKKPFSGVIRGSNNDYVSSWFHKNVSDEDVLNAYRAAARIAAKKGHTTIHTMVGDGRKDLMHYQLIDKALKENPEMFSVNYVLYKQVFDKELALSMGRNRDEVNIIGGCILADGSFGSGTAALFEPYYNDKSNTGLLYKTNNEWFDFIEAVHNSGVQIAVHCIGDAAISQIVEIYSSLQKDNPKDLRHQIIHCELITDEEIISKMAHNNVAAVMQPMFDRLWGGEKGMYSDVLGKERAMKCNRLKSLVSAGVLVTGGSDWYITDMDALAGIDAAVNLHNEKERLNPYKALQLYTCNAAKLIRRESEYGYLLKGYKADFVVLERNILTDNNIADIPVKSVYRNGKPVYVDNGDEEIF